MSGLLLLVGSMVIFFVAYVTYGSWLCKKWGVDPTRKTPAERLCDNVDYMPTKPAVLMGHHFSSIAGAFTRCCSRRARARAWGRTSSRWPLAGKRRCAFAMKRFCAANFHP